MIKSQPNHSEKQCHRNMIVIFSQRTRHVLLQSELGTCNTLNYPGGLGDLDESQVTYGSSLKEGGVMSTQGAC